MNRPTLARPHVRRAANLLLALVLVPIPQEPEVRRESWPDGSRRIESEIVRLPDGSEVREGSFSSWFENGQLESEGRYSEDRRTGHWTFYHENGSVAAEGSFASGLEVGAWHTYYASGERRSRGGYDKGERTGRWSFWNEDGSEDEVDSGKYELYRSDGNPRLFKGPLLDGTPHGTWVSYWPGLRVQLEASYVRGKRQGELVFHHPDGCISTTILSGVYEDDRWVAPLPGETPERTSTLADLPEPGPSLAGEPENAQALGEAVDVLLALDPQRIDAIWKRIDERGGIPPSTVHPWRRGDVRTLPVVLRRMLAFDPETADGRRAIGLVEGIVLRSICRGHRLSRYGPEGPPDARSARELVRSWLSLWEATRSDGVFWFFELPQDSSSPPIGAGRDMLLEPPIFERKRSDPGYARRFEPSNKKRRRTGTAWRRATEDALAWLAAHQSADGSWDSDGFPSACGKIGKGVCDGAGRNHDVGITGLALLALLGDGSTPDEGPYAANVAGGVNWIFLQQDGQGIFRTIYDGVDSDGNAGRFYDTDWIYEHGIATLALSEALGTLPRPAAAPLLQKAVDVIHAARNPYGAWRYDLPATGNNDTSVTGWMLSALLAARRAGLNVDEQAITGGLAWFQEVSDPATGRVGYDSFGSLSSRTAENERWPREKTEAMTAVALLCRLLVGSPDDEMIAKHAALLDRTLPVWDPEGFGCDMYYWYYGTNAMYQLGGSEWKAWEAAMKKAFVDSQRGEGDLKGSWDPVGPWGYMGGRVYSTAIMALCLEVNDRYPRVDGD